MADARQLLTGEQCREARRLLGLHQEALARAANVHAETITSFESGRKATFPVQVKLRAALEAAGVVFTDGDEPAVKLRKDKAP